MMLQLNSHSRALVLASAIACSLAFILDPSYALLAQRTDSELDSGVKKNETPNVLFLVGERQYNTKKTLAEFAKSRLQPMQIECQFVRALTDDRQDPRCHEFPKLIEALENADLLVLSVRRRFLTDHQLETVRKWIDSGKPVIGIRTASHAFAAFQPSNVPLGRAAWQDFDQDVFGGKYISHYQNKTEPVTEIWVAENASSQSIMDGVTWSGKKHVDSQLYIIQELQESAAVFIYGQVPGDDQKQPVAWTYRRKPGKGFKSFYTTLGSVKDFENPFFTRLLSNAIQWGLE